MPVEVSDCFELFVPSNSWLHIMISLNDADHPLIWMSTSFKWFLTFWYCDLQILNVLYNKLYLVGFILLKLLFKKTRLFGKGKVVN